MKVEVNAHLINVHFYKLTKTTSKQAAVGTERIDVRERE